MRFIGTIEAKVDTKGRTIVPAVFRKVLQELGEERVVLRKDDFQPCLVIYPESTWSGLVDTMRSRLNRWDPQQQMMFRQFVADVEVQQPDSMGRILIPRRYQQMTGIERSVKVIGMDDCIELWPYTGSNENRQQRKKMTNKDTEKIVTADGYHVPVLLNESIDALCLKPGGVYVDVTFGGGGHSREILRRLDPTSRLFSFDQDADAERNVPEGCDGFTFVRSNFRYLKNWMRYYDIDHIDGLLADLGVSSHHFDDAERGFSFRFDAPLDMRMNKRAGKTAADIVNTYSEEQLADVFYLYGELKNSRRIAAALAKARTAEPIATTQQFMKAVEPLFRREREKKEMAKLFQALRIEVNHEMTALKQMLAAATELLAPGGRLSVITYHSLEDRIVKNVMKTGNAEGKTEQDFFGRTNSPFTLVNNKVIVPSEDEQQRNPRSRSAKLRIAEKK